MAGAETPIALGQVPFDQQDASLPADQAALTSAENQAAAYADPSTGRHRGGFSITDAAYGGTNADLFPQTGRDLQVGRTTQIGKYGGAPIFQPTTGVLPLGIIAGKLRSIENEREKLKQQGKSLDLYGDFEKAKRAEYQPALNKWVMAQVEPAMNDAVKFYNGDTVKARAALSDPTNPFHQRVYGPGGIIESTNAVTRQANQKFDETEQLLTGMDKGELEEDPVLRTAATDVQRALGEYSSGDVRDLNRIFGKLDGVRNVEKRIKEMQADDRIFKLAGIDAETKARIVGGTKVLTTDETRRLKQARDSVAESIANDPISKGRVTVDYVKSKLPAFDQVNRSASQVSTGGSSGGSAKDAGYSYSYQHGPIQTSPGVVNQYDQIPLAHVSAGKGRLAAPNQFFDATGTPIFMHPTAIVEKNGERQVYGKVAKEPGTSRVDQDENGNVSFFVTDKGTGEEKKVSETQYFNTLQDYFVPYDGQNEGSVQNSFPGLTKEKVVSTLEAGKSKRGAPKAAAAETKKVLKYNPVTDQFE